VKFRGLGAGNVLSGCRAWNNADDGYDFWQAENGVTVQNCWAFHNGIAATFVGDSSYAGDGNGIKLGHDSSTHLLKNMLVWGNPAHGIDINGNATQLEGDPPTITHGVTILNNTSYNNGGKNFNFDENPTTASPPTNHVLRNNISYQGSVTVLAGNTSDHNTWNPGLTAAAGDFVSLVDPVTANGLYHPITDRMGTTGPSYGSGAALGPRQTDGSLPDLNGFLRLAVGSHLIDAGVNVGLPYIGSAADLGAFEFVPAGNAYWGVASGGAVETVSNWIAGVAPGPTTIANFDLGAGSTYTVTFAGNRTHGALAVRSGTVTLALSGNTYTLAGGVSGAGMLVVNGGTLSASSVRIDAVSIPSGTVAIRPDGGASGTSNLGALNLSGTGKLDLSNNKLVTATDVATITARIASGRNGGAWNGNGIITSQSAATTSNLTSIGVASASDVGITATAIWSGQTVSAGSTLVMYTYGGDANLDGKLNVDDYGRIDTNIGLGTSGWFNGDFNYDGKVNVDDYGILDSNIGIQGAPFSTALAATARVARLSAVPEPSLGSFVGAVALLMRRRRAKLQSC
jgi:hypothetical protein